MIGFRRLNLPPSLNIIKVLTVIVVDKGWKSHPIGVEEAFARAGLNCPVFMRLLAGCGARSGTVVNLTERFAESSRLVGSWYSHVSKSRVQFGMEQFEAYPCIERKTGD